MENVVSRKESFIGSKLSWVYFWLAMTMVPTVIGSMFMINNQDALLFYRENLIAVVIGYLVIGLILMFTLHKVKGEPMKMGIMMVISLLVGMFIGPIIEIYISGTNSSNVFMYSISATIALLVVLSIVGSNKNKDFSFLSTPLLISFVAIIVLFVIYAIFSEFSFLSTIISIAIIVWSSFSMIWEVNRLVRNEDSSITECVLGVYLDVINIFINILHLFGGDD